jgi:basic amino acid/polyamine antiporter, APA family
MNPKRQLGLVTATALIVANMVGTGVFTTSGFLLGDLKSPWTVLAAWGVGGLIAMLGALCYGALARRIPESGGEYVFLSRTLHPWAGCAAGWVSLLVGFSAPLAAAAIAFGEYAKPWLPAGEIHLPGTARVLPWPQAAGTLLVLVFTALHAAHVQRGAWVQNGAVVLKVVLIGLFVAFGLTHLQGQESLGQPARPVSDFAISLVWISFSYSGWNAAIYLGGEIRDPERNLPLSMLLGTGLVMLLYVTLNAVFVFSTAPANLAGKLEVGRIAAQAVGGPGLASAVTALVALVLVSSVSSLIMAGPRVYARMAADGYLPRWLAAGEGPPRAAIALQAVLALAMLWTATYGQLLTAIGFTLSLSTAATVAGLMRLRLREGPRLRVPGWPWVPLLFLAFVLFMAAFTAWRAVRPLFEALLK